MSESDTCLAHAMQNTCLAVTSSLQQLRVELDATVVMTGVCTAFTYGKNVTETLPPAQCCWNFLQWPPSETQHYSQQHPNLPLPTSSLCTTNRVSVLHVCLCVCECSSNNFCFVLVVMISLLKSKGDFCVLCVLRIVYAVTVTEQAVCLLSQYLGCDAKHVCASLRGQVQNAQNVIGAFCNQVDWFLLRSKGDDQ